MYSGFADHGVTAWLAIGGSINSRVMTSPSWKLGGVGVSGSTSMQSGTDYFPLIIFVLQTSTDEWLFLSDRAYGAIRRKQSWYVSTRPKLLKMLMIGLTRGRTHAGCHGAESYAQSFYDTRSLSVVTSNVYVCCMRNLINCVVQRY